jgi:hypothetical protein
MFGLSSHDSKVRQKQRAFVIQGKRDLLAPKHFAGALFRQGKAASCHRVHWAKKNRVPEKPSAFAEKPGYWSGFSFGALREIKKVFSF